MQQLCELNSESKHTPDEFTLLIHFSEVLAKANSTPE